jgi:Na+:H+ antiporter, NhaC family
MTSDKKPASMTDALIPIVAIIVMLTTSVSFYGSDSSYGANQIALILGAAIASIIGFKNGYTWNEIESGIVKGISMSLGAMLILLMVGSLIGSWTLAGTVPSMIYYGLQILNPSIFYAAACVICAVVSISIGSSWTTAGTVGVALIGIATGLDMSLGITAGAVISGAYFGDKMSPLSDTTNLAPAVTGTELFTHIRHMMWTTGPSILIAIVVFLIIGFLQSSSGNQVNLTETVIHLKSQFNISLWALIPLLLVLVLAYQKKPAFLTLLAGALFGCLFAIIFQPEAIQRTVASKQYQCEVVGDNSSANCQFNKLEFDAKQQRLNITLSDEARSENYQVSLEEADAGTSVNFAGKNTTLSFQKRSAIAQNLDAVWHVLFAGYQSDSGHPTIDNLLSRGGMVSMLNTIFLILCAMTFGAVLETIGLLQRFIQALSGAVKTTGSLFTSVILTCIGTNIIAADQYIAIVLPGRMFRAEFKKRGLAPKNLSRALEDSATITSPLIPWNTCGAYMAGALGVPTLVYLPYCIFNLVNPFISIFYGFTNFKITRIANDQPTPNPTHPS